MYVFYWKINVFLRKTGKDIGQNLLVSLSNNLMPSNNLRHLMPLILPVKSCLVITDFNKIIYIKPCYQN